MMRRFGKIWREYAGLHRRESDEREQFISLLAIRDAFMIVVLGVLVIVPAFLLFRDSLPSVVSGAAALPLAMMVVSGAVILLSWTIRGGGLSFGTIAFRGAVYFGAFLAAGGLLWGVSRAGVVPPHIGLLPLATGSVTGVAVAMCLQSLASHRNR